jgi:hypothetical protein
MAFGPSEAQALAVFTASGEASRFLASQKWQVTFLVLSAYVALTAAPRLISGNAANGVRDRVSLGCVVLAALIAVAAWYHLLACTGNTRNAWQKCTRRQRN